MLFEGTKLLRTVEKGYPREAGRLLELQNFKAFAFAESGSSRNNREIQRFSLSILPALDVASSEVKEQVDDSFIPSFWTSISRPKSKTIFQLFCICEIVVTK